MEHSSGVGVVDKVVTLLDQIATGPRSLVQLTEVTGLPRATAHRLAVALEHLGVLARDDAGRFVFGPRMSEWGTATDELRMLADESVHILRDRTGLSAQAYRRLGDERRCIAAAEPRSGLRDGVPVGTQLTLRAGSGAQVLMAWLAPPDRDRLLTGAAFTADDLAAVRRRGWAHSVGQRASGVASISAPVFGPGGQVLMALSLSGPMDSLSSPDAGQCDHLLSEAARLSAVLSLPAPHDVGGGRLDADPRLRM